VYAAGMGSGATIHIPSFIKTGSGSQKLIGWGIRRHRQEADRISLLEGSRLKNENQVRSLCLLFGLLILSIYRIILPLSKTKRVSTLKGRWLRLNMLDII
jgi:hypothetical protein